MGCCGSDNGYSIFDPLDSKLTVDTGAKTFDEFMKSCIDTINTFEDMRKVVAVPYGKLLCQSGAVVLEKPTVFSCLLGLIYQAARDIGEGIDQVVRVKSSSPYVEINAEAAKKGLAGDVQSTADCFVELIKALEPLEKDCEKLFQQGEKLLQQASENDTKWMEEFKGLAGDFTKLRETMSKSYENSKKLSNAFGCIRDIYNLIKALVTDSMSFFEKMTKQPDELKKLYELARKINTDAKTDKTLVSNRRLYFNYTLEKKQDWETGLKPTWKKIKNEDYAEKGPEVVVKKDPATAPKKEETKKEEGKKEEGKKEEVKKVDAPKKEEEKKIEKAVEKKEEKIDAKLYLDLQAQINELKKEVDTLRNTKQSGHIYVHKPLALRNWNLSLRNSFETGMNNYVKSIAVNFEHDVIVFGTKDGTLLTYKLSTFEQLNANKIHNGTIRDVVYLYDGSHVVSAGNDGKIVKTDVTTHESKESSHILPGEIKSIAYAQDGSTLYAASGRCLYYYDLHNLDGKYEHKVHDFSEDLLKVIYIKHFKCLGLGFRNGTVRLYDPGMKQVIAEFSDHKGKRVTDLEVIKFNGAHALASTSKDMTINIYDLEEKALKNTIRIASTKTSTHASGLHYGHDEKTVFSIHGDGKIILNKYDTGDLTKEQTSRVFNSSSAKLSAGFYVGDGCTFIVAMQPDQQGGNGKVEIYVSK